MYQKEVPQYTKLRSLVDKVNTKSSIKVPLPEVPRHGAVRLACLEELRLASRFLDVMGMKSVGHYDLSSAGLPIHATAFRPITQEGLATAPFRLFVSVLRPELLTSSLRPLAKSLLGQRPPVFRQRTIDLVDVAQSKGGLTPSEADELIQGGCETLAWRNQVSLSKAEYAALRTDQNGDLLIDIMAFRNPHLNHLTPATVDIDHVQDGMTGAGLEPKNRVEGPPERKCNVLLRQTSFLAVDEGIVFDKSGDPGAGERGSHSARFGEVEQRGAALTNMGRARYDEAIVAAKRRRLLEEGREHEYKALFDALLPDDWEALRKEGLIWTKYSMTGKGEDLAKALRSGHGSNVDLKNLEQALDEGFITWKPILYEDFLPLSAAGIFQSNLHQDVSDEVEAGGKQGIDDGESRRQLSGALGDDGMIDEMGLYQIQQVESLQRCRDALGLGS